MIFWGIVSIPQIMLSFCLPFSLTKSCSNNITEYEVVIIGLKVSSKIPVVNMTIYSVFGLILNNYAESTP